MWRCFGLNSAPVSVDLSPQRLFASRPTIVCSTLPIEERDVVHSSVLLIDKANYYHLLYLYFNLLHYI